MYIVNIQGLFLVLLVEGELQVTGVGEIAVQIRSSKSATYRCKLNDREFVDCKLHIFDWT